MKTRTGPMIMRKWRRNDRSMQDPIVLPVTAANMLNTSTLIVIALLLVTLSVADDWPQDRHDLHNTGASTESMGGRLVPK